VFHRPWRNHLKTHFLHPQDNRASLTLHTGNLLCRCEGSPTLGKGLPHLLPCLSCAQMLCQVCLTLRRPSLLNEFGARPIDSLCWEADTAANSSVGGSRARQPEHPCCAGPFHSKDSPSQTFPPKTTFNPRRKKREPCGINTDPCIQNCSGWS